MKLFFCFLCFRHQWQGWLFFALGIDYVLQLCHQMLVNVSRWIPQNTRKSNIGANQQFTTVFHSFWPVFNAFVYAFNVHISIYCNIQAYTNSLFGKVSSIMAMWYRKTVASICCINASHYIHFTDEAVWRYVMLWFNNTMVSHNADVDVSFNLQFDKLWNIALQQRNAKRDNITVKKE